MTRVVRRDAVSRAAHVLPAVVLIAVNVAAALIAALLLPMVAALPAAMAMHGALMIVGWGCLLPLGGIVARYFKVTPEQDFPAVVDNPFWWNCHRVLQYSGVALATVAAVLMLRVTGGRIATLHGWCGLVVMVLAWVQLASPLFRGTKGGPADAGRSGPEDSAWRGDHFDMTPRRRLFEAWHKPLGWGLLVGAQGVILLGLDLAGSPPWGFGLAALMMGSLGLAILDSALRGRWISTHAALWGPGREPSKARTSKVRTRLK